MNRRATLLLHWFSTWRPEGTAGALAALERSSDTSVVGWHSSEASPPAGISARAFRAGHDGWRALNEGVPVFDLRGATAEHAWIAQIATSAPGIVLLAAGARAVDRLTPR